MTVDLRHIRCFVAVAEELHFRRAAEKLGIAQPALSRTIRNLENDLRVDLFDRSNRSVRITKAGKSFLDGSRRVTNSLEAAVDNARRVHQGKIGSLRVGYTDIAIAGVVPGLVREFQARQPDIAMKLKRDVTVSQLKKLEEGELDVGFVTGPFSRSGYEQLLVQSEPFVCVTCDSHPLASRKCIRLDELAHEDFVHGSLADWEVFYSYLIPLCRRSGFVPRIVQEGATTAAILGLVACGLGVTILTESVRASVGSGLSVVPFEDVSEQLQTVAVWKSDMLDGPQGLFVDFLRDAPRATPSGLANRHA